MKRILCVSDMHCGHLASVMPDEVDETMQDGEVNIHYNNALQNVLYKQWLNMATDVGRVDAVFDLGDNIEGPNYKERGYGLWTPNIETQCHAAAQLLSLINTRKYFMVFGSNYHVGTNPYSEEVVASKLREMTSRPVESSKELLVNIDEDVKAHLLHEISVSTSTWQYRSTPLAKEMLLADINKYELGRIRLILRGHAHYYAEVRYGSSIGAICPGWKLRDSFTAKLGLATIPRCGWLMITCKNGKIDVEPHIIKEKMKYMKEVKV